MDESTLIGRLWRQAMEGFARLRSGRPTASKLERIRGTVHIKNLDTNTEREICVESPEVPGWNPFVKGWSIGGISSGANIQLDEPLDGCQLGIFPASNHIVLWGQVNESSPLPPIDMFYQGEWRHKPKVEESRLWFRFDYHPLRIGRHALLIRWQRVP